MNYRAREENTNGAEEFSSVVYVMFGLKMLISVSCTYHCFLVHNFLITSKVLNICLWNFHSPSPS